MDQSPLTLISFARPPTEAAVRGVLTDLGYRPQVLVSQAKGRNSITPTGAVMFLLGAGAEGSADLKSSLAAACGVPSLAMVVSGEGGWDRELLSACRDCALWPCAKDELAFRLRRLCQPSGNTVPVGLDPLLTETLAGLNLIGRAPAFTDSMTRLRRVAGCDAPVLVQGETGTGKELAARAIHYLGSRRDGPFVPVNCGALPDHLVENELFGHERGAYTDAKTAALGAIGEAAGGTLFLDEVEALSPKAQGALLRFLQDREYRPLGAARPRQSDARVVAASNADLRALGEVRAFRPDLYYRLDILTITLPPLRARRDDIALLAQHFLDHFSRQYALPLALLDAHSLPGLLAYDWPGNVRELENLVHRQRLLAGGALVYLSPGDGHPGSERMGAGVGGGMDAGQSVLGSPATGSSGLSFAQAKARAIASFERDYLTCLMTDSKGNVSQAARRANKERRALGRLLKKYNISVSSPG